MHFGRENICVGRGFGWFECGDRHGTESVPFLPSRNSRQPKLSIMFKGNVGHDKVNGAIEETEAARAERERLEAVMAQRIEEQRKRKAEEEANKSIFRRPGPAVSAEDLSGGPAGENEERSAFAQTRYVYKSALLVFLPFLRPDTVYSVLRFVTFFMRE